MQRITRTLASIVIIGSVSLFLSVTTASAAVSGGTIAGTAAADLVVGAANADYDVAFDTNVAATAASLTITFPAGYAITDGDLGTTAVCNSDCSLASKISVNGVNWSVNSVTGSAAGRTIVIAFQDKDLGTGTGTAFRITTGITNRTTSGATGTFTITNDATGETAQSDVAAVTLTPGAATVLAVTQQPSGSVSGVALTTQPIVTARDQYGNTDTNFTETITLTEASAGSLANATEAAVAGVADFSVGEDLIYTATADQQAFVLTADDDAGVGTDLTGVAASSVTSNVVATAIVITTAPADAAAVNGHVRNGIAFATQPVVTYRNAGGLTDTDIDADVVTVSLTAGAGTLATTLTATATDGVATFTDLKYTLAGGESDQQVITLSFVDDAGNGVNLNAAPVTDDSTVDVVATLLAFTTQPADSVSGVSLTQPVVTARDAEGKTDTNFVGTVTLTEASAGTLADNTEAAVAGVATFANTADVIYTASADQQAFTLTAASDGVTSGTANEVTSNVIATTMAFTTQPGSIVAGVSMTQPVVKYVDAAGITDTAVTDTLTISENGNGSLAGTVAVAAVAGSVTYTDLVYTALADAEAVTFTFTDDVAGINLNASPLASDAKTADVVATKMVWTVEPSGCTAGLACTGQGTIQAQNAGNLLDTGYTTSVTIAETGLGTLVGTANQGAMTAGALTTSGIGYSATADGQTFTFTADSGSLTQDATEELASDVVATQLVFTQQPAGSVSGAALTTQPIIEARNAAGVKDTGFTETITLTEASAGSLTNATEAAVAGVADFSTGDDAIYTATADQQAFVLTADDDAGVGTDLGGTAADSVTSDVVATVIALTTAPADAAAVNGHVRNGIAFATQPIVTFRNGAGLTDVDIDADVVTVSVTAGAGTLGGTLTATATNGVATFTNVLYTLEAAESDQQVVTLSFADDAAGAGAVNLSGSPVTDDSTVDVVATLLAFTTQPSNSVSGVSLTQPVVTARDAAGKTDTNFVGTVTLTEASAGTLADNTEAAVAGVATFANTADVIYTASADQEAFVLTAASDGVTSGVADSVTSDVIATVLAFTTQPAGSVSGIALTTQPVVTARDAAGTTDTGFTETITLTEASAGSITGSTQAAVSGVATFTALNYTATADQQAFTLTADDDAGVGTNLATADAAAVTSDVVATKFLVTLNSYTPTAGSAATLTITAANAGDLTDTGYDATGKTYTFTDSVPAALSTHTSPGANAPTIPSSSDIITAFGGDGVAGGLSLTFTKSEVLGVLTVSDATLSGNSSSVTVRHATAASFTVTPETLSPTADTAYDMTVTAKDTYGNTVSGANGATAYTGTVFLSTNASSPTWHTPWTSFITGDAGTKTLSNAITYSTAEGSVTVTAQESDGSPTGTSSAITVTSDADVTGPTISSQTPADNATGVAITASPTVTFSEALSPGTITTGIELRLYSDDTVVPSTITYNPSTFVVTVDPVSSLANSTQYYLYASTGVTDAAGNALTTAYGVAQKASHEFTTTAESVTLALTRIDTTRSTMTADATYANGGSWTMNITVPTSETNVTLAFADWTSGANSIATADNMRIYSAQSSNAATSGAAITITAASTASTALALTGDLDATTAGRQIQVVVDLKVPLLTSGGSYSTSYTVASATP